MMKSRISETFASVLQTFRRFPMVLTMALCFAICALTVILDHNIADESMYQIGKLAMTFGFGIALMFGIKMLSQRIGRQFILEIIGCIILIIYYFVFPENSKELSVYYFFIIAPVVVIFHLFVAVAPFFTKNDDVSFWRYNKNLFVNFILTMIFTGVLVAGVELAIVAVDSLFPIDFDERIYPAIGSFLAIFGSAFVFLRFNENGLPTLEKDEDYPVVLKFFVQYILIPLLLIYGVILYFYTIKILINWELPKGWVSYLIMSYAVVGILAILLVHPLVSSAKSWVKGFSKIFFFTLIPLLVLLFVAIKTRILAYGFTEPRYYLLLIALWLCAVVAHFVIFRKHTIRFVPMSLLFFGIFGLMFPYLNATAVSVRSQEHELMEFLAKYKLLNNGKIDFSKKLKNSYDVSDKVNFLLERKDKSFILNLLTEKDKKDWGNELQLRDGYYFSEKFNGNNTYDAITLTKAESDFITIESSSTKVSVEGYDYLQTFNIASDYKIGQDSIQIDDDLNVTLNTSEKISLKPQLQAFAEKIKSEHPQENYLSVPEISAVAEFKKYRVKFLFTNITMPEKGKISPLNPTMILVKEK